METAPILRCRVRLLGEGVSETELNGIESQLSQEVEESFQLAMAAPFPEEADLSTDVYCEEV